MAMIVKNNMGAKNTLNELNKNEKAKSKDLKKLASGLKIGSAADDASGYAISERMAVQIRGLDQDSQNTQNSQALMKTASGALDSTMDILKTLKEKAINAANDTNTDADRATIQKEVDQAIQQIDENAQVTYNGKTMLDGSKNSEVTGPQGQGTSTYLTNEYFADNTSKLSSIVELQSKTGEKLNILPGDKIIVSYVKNGVTYTNADKPIEVTDATFFGEMFEWTPCSQDLDIDHYSNTSKIGVGPNGEDVYTTDGKNAISYHAKNPGLDGQIAGLSIRVEDSEGNPKKSINRIMDNFTETIRAQDPSPDNAMTFQVGTKANQSIRLGFTDMRSYALGLSSKDGKAIDISSQVSANAAISAFDNAVEKVLAQQTTLGAVTSRMDYTNANIVTASENVTASKSVISDADMAKEMTSFTKNNILTQAAQSMLAQANQTSSAVLSLLQ
ncbi:MAG: flagellin [Selenomonadaceae bacterium]|nr:flagellin [Selenomonadaceae bacterium]